MSMKVLKYIKNVFATIIVLILMICALSAYIKWEPPMSVLLVPFRMILQFTIKYQIFILIIIVAAYMLYAFNKHKKILKRSYNFSLIIICMLV